MSRSIHEDTVSREVRVMLKKIMPTWKIRDQPLRTFKKEARKDTPDGSKEAGRKKGGSPRPDILVEKAGKSSVIIESEIAPANPNKDAEKRFSLAFKSGRPVTSVIALRIPSEYGSMDSDDMAKILPEEKSLEYAVYIKSEYDTRPKRFPATGWLVGGVFDLAVMSQVLSDNEHNAKLAINAISDKIESIGSYLDGCSGMVHENIAKLLRQKITGKDEDETEELSRQTSNMAALILFNAFIFHNKLGGMEFTIGGKTLRIMGLDELIKDGKINRGKLLCVWDDIRRQNYHPIFNISRKILLEVDQNTASNIIMMLYDVSNCTEIKQISGSIDMHGSLIQTMITERKRLKAYYTRAESATLLASLLVPSHADPRWDGIEGLIIADFACGTGTLLSSIYKQIVLYANMSHKSGTISELLHKRFLEGGMIGLDVLPSAVHLTVSTLAGFRPDISIGRGRLGIAKYGARPDNKPRLGALDLIDPQEIFDDSVIYATGRGEDPTPFTEIGHGSCDIIIMNPPFTRNTKSDSDQLEMYAAFGVDKDTQGEMREKTKSLFKNTCADGRAGYPTYFMAVADKKLKPGGMLGLVVPSTVAYGDSWRKLRELVRERYEWMCIISINGSAPGCSESGTGRSFSSDTKMAEVLLVARKHDSGSLRAIDNLKRDIKSARSKIKRTGNLLKKHAGNDAKTARLAATMSLYEKNVRQYGDALAAIHERKRGLFVSLDGRPGSSIESVEIARLIRTAVVPRAETLVPNTTGTHRYSGFPISTGRVIGHMLDCPMQGPWWFVNVASPLLTQFALNLAGGRVVLTYPLTDGDDSVTDIPMTVLGDSGIGPRRGLTENFDIGPASNNFDYPVLYDVSKDQRTMGQRPDRTASPKRNAPARTTESIKRSRSRAHINIQCRFNTQSLLAAYTNRPSLGESGFPTVLLGDGGSRCARFEKPFVAWQNSTLGAVCLWAAAPKQQMGRSKAVKQNGPDIPVLDFSALEPGQVSRLAAAYDGLKGERLRPVRELDRDMVRKRLDSEVLGALGIDADIGRLRELLCREPSISNVSADLGDDEDPGE